MLHPTVESQKRRPRVVDLDAHPAQIDLLVAEALKKALASLAIDMRPVMLDMKGAMDYSGLSKTSLNNLLREEKISARKEGVKNLFERESIDRYLKSLPAWGTQEAASMRAAA